jgi:hypothetical protein
MKKLITLIIGLIILLVPALPARAETNWTQSVSRGAQFDINGNVITITHTTVPDGLDYIEQTFSSAQDVTFEFGAKIGSENNDSYSLVMESDGGNAADGLWLSFNQNGLCDLDNLIAPFTLDQWYYYRIESTRNKLLIYVNGQLKYERTGSFKPRSFLRFRDYGRCSGIVTNYLNNVSVSINGTIGSHGAQFVTENNLLKIIHSIVPYGYDYHQESFAPAQDVMIQFDAKIGSLNNDNYSLLIDSDGEAESDGLRLAFNQNKLCYYYNTEWHEIATVVFDQWSHYRIVSTRNKLEIYVNEDIKYQQPGTFHIRSYVRFKDYGLCSGTVVNYIANFKTRLATANDTSFCYDNFNFQPLTGWDIQAGHGTGFAQHNGLIRITHSTQAYGFDSIRQSFISMNEAVFEFDARIGSTNNDNFSLLLESDGGYAAPGGLGLTFNGNQVMTYANNQWQKIFTIPFDAWRHYRIVSTPNWMAIYINDDLKYKVKGSFQARGFLKFSDYGLCSGTVVNYLANVRTRPAVDTDKAIIFDDFDTIPLTGWLQETTHGTQFSQNSNGIQIIHSTTANGFDNIEQTFMPMAETVFEFDAKIGSLNNDNFSLLVESDGGYAASNGLGLAFRANMVMVYSNNNWQSICTIPFNTWRHYRIVSTSGWVAIYINDDLKYKRNGSFRIRSFIKFSDFGMCSGPVINNIANVQTRATTTNDKYIIFEDFNNTPLTGWTQSVHYSTQFTQNSGGIRIVHSTMPNGFDYIQKSFDSLTEAVFEFDARIGSENNDNFSLLLESDGGYSATDGLGLAFRANSVMVYANNEWKTIGNVSCNEWRHYRIVSTPNWIAVYINDDLKYKRNGGFRSRSYLKFSDFGLCSGTVTNYLANVNTRPATGNDKFII